MKPNWHSYHQHKRGVKNPVSERYKRETWTGDATPRQRAYLVRLTQQTGVHVENIGSLTKYEASKHIERLQAMRLEKE